MKLFDDVNDNMISLSVRNIEKLIFYMLQVYFNCLFIQWKVVTHLYFPLNSRGMLITYEAQTKTLTQHNTTLTRLHR